MGKKLRILLYVDGGARGNPGPAACAAVLKTPEDGQTVLDEARYLGETTNNVAEYEGLLLGLELAARLKATDLDIRSDSELLVRQMAGQYRVKNPALKERHRRVEKALEAFEGVEIRHVPREENPEADRLLNETLNAHRRKKSENRSSPAGRNGSFRLK